jgi:hypothetical protein
VLIGTSANLSDEEFKRLLAQCNNRNQGVATNARASCHQALAHGDYLALYALPLIFPYDSYLGTPAKGIGDHIDSGEGLSRCLPVSDLDQDHGCGTERCRPRQQ